jgi:hypothetical protein
MRSTLQIRSILCKSVRELVQRERRARFLALDVSRQPEPRRRPVKLEANKTAWINLLHGALQPFRCSRCHTIQIDPVGFDGRGRALCEGCVDGGEL